MDGEVDDKRTTFMLSIQRRGEKLSGFSGKYNFHTTFGIRPKEHGVYKNKSSKPAKKTTK